MVKNPSKIKNKIKRTQMYAKYKQQKKKVKKQLKEEINNKNKDLDPELVPPKPVPVTIDSSREVDETLVQDNDDEIAGDEKDDEFSQYFNNTLKPKIMLTTRPKCSSKLFSLIGDIMQLIPNTFYYPRGKQLVKDMASDAVKKGFTHVMLLSEKNKECNGLLVTHLPAGPTAFFKFSSYIPADKIPGHGNPTSHIPELILNNFVTRLGRRMGRFVGSLFPHEPQLEGRQVVTFHNQRDFIFVRHHRYIYRKEKDKTRARLQELGPRFTLKPRWLQEGTFDAEFGEYEWVFKRKEMETSRKKFQL